MRKRNNSRLFYQFWLMLLERRKRRNVAQRAQPGTAGNSN